jgi:hypothetical protein
MARNHKGELRKKVSAAQVKKLVFAIQTRITEDAALPPEKRMSAAELVSLTTNAAALVQTLHKIDQDHARVVSKRRKEDIFSPVR